LEATGERRNLAHNRLQEGGFTAAVGAEHCHTLTALDQQFGHGEQRLSVAARILVPDRHGIDLQDEPPALEGGVERERGPFLLLRPVNPLHPRQSLLAAFCLFGTLTRAVAADELLRARDERLLLLILLVTALHPLRAQFHVGGIAARIV